MPAIRGLVVASLEAKAAKLGVRLEPAVGICQGCNMKIFLAGGTGFLGKCVCRALAGEGHVLTILARPGTDTNCFGRSVGIVRGDPTKEGKWQESLVGQDAVINLAGASIFQRWTQKTKEEIIMSRILSTRNIVNTLKGSHGREVHLLNASGVGYYGYCGKDIIDEQNPPGDSFLATVAESWESEARKAEDAGIRVVLCRFGIVLGRDGGAFQQIHPLFRFHLGALWGMGEQWFSWIHEKDTAGIISFLLEHKEISGPVNISSPNPVTNREMAETLSMLLNKRPYIRRLPKWFFRLILGEFSEVFLEGQKVRPGVLLDEGFIFRFPILVEAVTDLINCRSQYNT
jgi:uncharacterized protein